MVATGRAALLSSRNRDGDEADGTTICRRAKMRLVMSELSHVSIVAWSKTMRTRD